jgi:hypothetical protein
MIKVADRRRTWNPCSPPALTEGLIAAPLPPTRPKAACGCGSQSRDCPPRPPGSALKSRPPPVPTSARPDRPATRRIAIIVDPHLTTSAPVLVTITISGDDLMSA